MGKPRCNIPRVIFVAMPNIDVVIPVFNQAFELGKCLQGLRDQTLRDFSVIIVDDGSLPPLDPVNARDLSVRMVRQKNAGASAARNRGAREGSAPYILFCDADIKLKKNAIQTFYHALNNSPTAAFAYSSFFFGRKLFRLWPFDVARLRHEPYIHTTSLLRRADFPGFDETLGRFQDWDLFLSLAARGKTGVWIDEPLFKVRPGGTMSVWLPRLAYQWLPWLPEVRRYRTAREAIARKHHFTV
ncbi:MAG: glycosyltransferase family A protein [bacterium]|nr:glycosyltransferase family A protein [bacterium]